MLQRLQELQPIELFRQRLERVLEEHVSPYDFHAAGKGWLRDAITARRFAELTSATRVGLIASAQPDFEVQYRNGRRLKFETTLADIAGRKMADEHKEHWDLGDTVRSLPDNIFQLRRHAIPAALATAATLKADKAKVGLYSPDTNLLIDLNLPTHGYAKGEIEDELVEFTRSARTCFNSIWVLWSGCVFRTWPQPFNGGKEAFRPKYHELGWAICVRSSQKMLDDIF